MLNPIDLALLPLRIARGVVHKLIGGGPDGPSDPAPKAKVESEPRVPSTPAPRAPAKPVRKRKPVAAKPKPVAATPKPGVSGDQTAARSGIATPAEMAARGEGRPPSPFGSTENDS